MKGIKVKTLKRIFNGVAALAMLVAPITASGLASAVKPTAPDNTEVVIKKQVLEVTNPVTNTFNFVITADANNPAAVTGVPATFTIPFANVAPVNKIAEQTYTLDFANVDFPKVGDYYFKITEATTGWSTDTDNIYPRDNDEWYAYVSVRYITDNNPTAVSGTPTTTMKATVANVGTENNTNFTPASNKGNITFDTTPEMTYIELEKKVTGNLGDITEYFEYTVEFGAKMASKNVTVIGTFADHVAGCTGIAADATSPKNITADASGAIKLCMKHNQSVTIGLSAATNGVAQIPLKKNSTENNTYKITETPKPADPTNTQYKYKIFIDANTSESSTGVSEKTLAPIPDPAATNHAQMVTNFNNNNKTKYTNNKEADPITGFFINYGPFILLAAFGIMGVCAVKKTSKREK